MAGDPTRLDRLALLFAATIALEVVLATGVQRLTAAVAQRTLADLRGALFARVQRLPMRVLEREPPGWLVARLTTDVDVLQDVFSAGLLTIGFDVLRALGIAALMLCLDWRLAVTCLALLPPVAAVMLRFRRVARRRARAVRDRLATVSGALEESLAGMETIALSRAAPRAAAALDRLGRAHRDAVRRATRAEVDALALVEATATVAVAVVLWEGAGRHAAGAVGLGTIVALVAYAQQLFAPIRDLGGKYAGLQASLAAAERLFTLLDREAEPRPAHPRIPVAKRGEVVFERVWFAYEGERWVLRDLSFRARAGELVALVGGSGSGKSTVVKLLERFYDAQRGRVVVDGVDVRDWDLRALRRRLAVVLQEVQLFPGTVAENVAFGRPDVPASAMARALDDVGAAGLVARLGGLGGRLGEGGRPLAAGERQLLAFARALAHDPALLVLDEATASVDPETERRLEAGLRRARRGRTVLVVAHRLATVESADRILVLDHGALREAGAHAALLARGGLYAHLWRLQQEGRAAG